MVYDRIWLWRTAGKFVHGYIHYCCICHLLISTFLVGMLEMIFSIFQSCGNSLISALVSTSIGTMLGSAGPASKLARGQYLIMLFLTSLTSLVLRFYGKSLLPTSITRLLTVCQSDQCIGNNVVYRLSFGMALFFTIMALTQSTRSVSSVHYSLGWIRLFILLSSIAAGFLGNDTFINGWVEFSRYAAIRVTQRIMWNTDMRRSRF
jgi:hypothetical protein